jgi:hypothetical protein
VPEKEPAASSSMPGWSPSLRLSISARDQATFANIATVKHDVAGTFQVFWVPKAGNSSGEYEDAFWPTPRRGQSQSLVSFVKPARFAVADGATESSYSKVWANLIVRAFGLGRLRGPDLAIGLEEEQRRWLERVGGRELPWYAEEKLRDGSHTAIIGLEFEPEGTWQAVAIGDCCVVQLRKDQILAAFPLSEAKEFNNQPYLVSTNSTENPKISKETLTFEGVWASDDAFFLMSDALACWFFTDREKEGTPWSTLRDLDTTDGKSFKHWIAELRAQGAMRNDDVTLVRVDFH